MTGYENRKSCLTCFIASIFLYKMIIVRLRLYNKGFEKAEIFRSVNKKQKIKFFYFIIV
jgi:hypothetical protein